MNKKRLFYVCILSVLFSFKLFAQVRPLPANIDTNTVNPEQIPGPEKLKALGATDDEIQQIIAFKERKLAEKRSKEGDNYNSDKPQKYEKQTNELEINKSEDSLEIVVDEKELPEKIFGHSFFKNNTIKFYDRANQLKAPDNYVLGVGDELNIAIWGYADYNEAFKIDENGAINPRLVGRIYLNGLTFKEAKGLIAGRFKGAYDLNNSQIAVTLLYSKIITVNVVGEVNKPGAYTVPAINTAFNILVTVGGIKSIGSVRKIYVKRAGQTIRTLDIYQYLTNPDSKQDFFLENNDYILIPPSERIVKISGQVKRPMDYELTQNDNLKSLIDYAGGFESNAYKKRIQIKRFLNSSETIIDIDYDSLFVLKKDFELYGGDEVLVRKIQSGYNNFVELVGAVKLPGNYELKPGERISDVIMRAEGLTYDVFDSRAYVVRLNSDLSKKYIPFNLKEIMDNPNIQSNIMLQNQDTIRVFSKSYFKDEFYFSVIGSVRGQGNYSFGEGLTLKDALYLAGGLKKEAAKNRIEISRAADFVPSSGALVPIRTIIKSVQIGEDLRLDKMSENFIIQPYDQIFVRSEPEFDLQKNIVLLGEVSYPGVYPILNKNEKVLSIINRAGGLTKYSFPEGATLKRGEFGEGYLFFKLQEILNDSLSKYNYIVKSGDTITIPKEDQLIQLTGAINYPNIDSLKQISAPFIAGKTAKYYVKNFGLGFNEEADKANTFVQESGGYVHRTKSFLFFRFSPSITKGSMVVVPKKIIKERDKKKSEPIDWNKSIENLTIKLTGLATLWLIFTKLKN